MRRTDISDGNIRYYEFENDQFHFLNEYKTPDPREWNGRYF